MKGFCFKEIGLVATVVWHCPGTPNVVGSTRPKQRKLQKPTAKEARTLRRALKAAENNFKKTEGLLYRHS
ncbi:hypothetical protein TNCV_253051 [Trichonephila clavipes]|nr:hypothetical protein TNCV_253051 [Trichonephila clavipes]